MGKSPPVSTKLQLINCMGSSKSSSNAHYHVEFASYATILQVETLCEYWKKKDWWQWKDGKATAICMQAQAAARIEDIGEF
jgi:hypothetical protein